MCVSPPTVMVAPPAAVSSKRSAGPLAVDGSPPAVASAAPAALKALDLEAWGQEEGPGVGRAEAR